MLRTAYTVTQDITVRLNSASRDSVLTLLANEPDPTLLDLQGKNGIYHAVKNLYVKNLSCTVEVPSLVATKPPTIANTDSDTTAMMKYLSSEWNENRKELEILKWDAQNSRWVRKAILSLVNWEGIPYKQYNLYDFLTGNLVYELGQGAKLGLRIRSFPGLLSGNDFVLIDGNYVVEYSFLTEQSTSSNNNIIMPESSETASITGNQILYRDPAWIINNYEFRSSSNLTGIAKYGYYFLRNKLHLLLYGGGGTNGALKKIQIVNQADDSILLEKTLAEIMGADSNVWANYTINTSDHSGKMCYLVLIDEDNSGQTYSFFCIDLNYVFSEE
ncbi:MAG: hypothetical protein AAGA60_10730 [Cyanobacteria bacterium P01_E01_bin.42]